MPVGPKPRILDGQRFGRLTVLSYSHSENLVVYDRVQCDCGTIKIVRRPSLMRPGTHSCGCSKFGQKNRLSHGMRKTSEYQSWASMKGRCLNPRNPKYPDYGGRGITVCERWIDFANFFADIGPKPSPSHTIERVNNDGNYEPGNCIWGTKKEQANNRRRPRVPGGNARSRLNLRPMTSEWGRRIRAAKRAREANK